VADGYPVIGYNHWSLVDNYEWGDYSARFGLYRVDALSDPTLTRTPTSGVDAYREIISGGGVGPDYRPGLPAAWCSLATSPDSCRDPVSAGGPRASLGGSGRRAPGRYRPLLSSPPAPRVRRPAPA